MMMMRRKYSVVVSLLVFMFGMIRGFRNVEHKNKNHELHSLKTCFSQILVVPSYDGERPAAVFFTCKWMAKKESYTNPLRCLLQDDAEMWSAVDQHKILWCAASCLKGIRMLECSSKWMGHCFSVWSAWTSWDGVGMTAPEILRWMGNRSRPEWNGLQIG